MIINHRTMYASLFYILIILLFIVSKPTFAFDEQNNIKPFGIGPTKTIISLGVVASVAAIGSFYIFLMIDVIFNHKIVYTT